MTPHEKLGLAVLGLILALLVLGTVVHYRYLARWWWPLVGSAWRAERHRVRLAQQAWDDVWPADLEDHNEYEHGRWGDGGVWIPGEPEDWEHLDPDSQADQLIAEWHQEPAPTEPWVYIPDRNTWRWQDDPDLIVWDARQQAARCWEIVHVEFPRLRRDLGMMAAA